MSQSIAITRFDIPRLEDLPSDIQQRIHEVNEQSGFIPNVFLVLARRPDEFRAFFAYHDALMEKPGNLTKAEREMIVVATSSANQCQYCVIAHGAILRVRAKAPLIADQIAINYRKADISARHKAMLDFAVKVTQTSYEVDERDMTELMQQGFKFAAFQQQFSAVKGAAQIAGVAFQRVRPTRRVLAESSPASGSAVARIGSSALTPAVVKIAPAPVERAAAAMRGAAETTPACERG